MILCCYIVIIPVVVLVASIEFFILGLLFLSLSRFVFILFGS